MPDYKCAESAKRYIKAYFTDFWGKVSVVYNNCNIDERPEIKKEILLLAERINYLINKSQ